MPTAQQTIWLGIAAAAVFLVTQYARALKYEDGLGEGWTVSSMYLTTLDYARISLTRVARDLGNLIGSTLLLFGIAGGAIFYLIGPLVGLDPVTWFFVIVGGVGSLEGFGMLETDPLLAIGVIFGMVAAASFLKWYVTVAADGD